MTQSVLRHKMLFIPRRCELEGCDGGGSGALSRCGRCKMVLYCSAAHQASDWPRHKVECGHLKKLDLVGFTFDAQAELVKYPLGALGADAPTLVGGKPSCGVCGTTKTRIVRTECCGLWLCDNSEEYQLFSYSRAFCARSHSRYTLCGAHYAESHSGDWRSCATCSSAYDSANHMWYAFNGYNFTPGLPQPKGTPWTFPCEVCGVRVAPGFEEYSSGGRGLTCGSC